MDLPRCSICRELIEAYQPRLNWNEKQWCAHTTCMHCLRCGRPIGTEGEVVEVNGELLLVSTFPRSINCRLIEDNSARGGFQPRHRACPRR